MNRTPVPSPADASRRRGSRAGARVLALALAAVLVAPSAVHAEPDVEDLDIDELTERAEDLEESYDGELLQFTEIKERAERAEADLEEVEEQLDGSRSSVVHIAASRYKSLGLDPALEMFFSSSPEQMFQDTATVEQLGRTQSGQISELVDLQAERAEAAEEAEAELTEAEDLIETLEEQREEVEEAIERYEAEQVPDEPETGSSATSGTIPESVKGWGFDGATPRMAAIRDEVILNVGVPYEVGCARNSADDHGTGQACDFMVAVIGTHPSAGNRSTGNAIAQYAIDNASRLGVKYVIWEQRIWQPSSGQWVAMSDRGSVTENHYDHVHISSY
ncbi:coiled-coil domain-containing protein [Nocardiopsis aegyptia]|uniref:Molecular chaperone GrpE (Heat shock protein) n=1 Tax=Nocardiopsis aegyptia TaxID=220378 RepID=A0A7Z0EJF7_9ACTN|nr:hypothetical protein [Nocardiopsis aegyptia]NYJ33194.1 molecular chaperone GrpE (heat shock protein) [Nocardiopsis aegyptia]